MTAHSQFITTSKGLDRSSPPMKLYEKAKKYGIWNPTDLDFSKDKEDWQKLSDDEKDVILRLTSMFQAGEEAVTLDLLPLINVIAEEGRIEEEMFLTTFLWEEAKHTDFFNRFLTEVAGVDGADLTRYHTDNYHLVFYEALPEALNRLKQDSSSESQVIASVTYNMIVEGVLAETGYHAYYTMLRNNDLMPATLKGIDNLKQDESRHIAYGIYLISRLVAENNELWDVADATMDRLMTPAMSVVTEPFLFYDPMPFGLEIDEFATYAMMQYQKRYERIAKAQSQTLDEVLQVTHQAIDQDDA